MQLFSVRNFQTCLVTNIFIITAPVPVTPENRRNVIKWMVDAQYKKEQVIVKRKNIASYMQCVLYNSSLYVKSLYKIYFILCRHSLIDKLYKLINIICMRNGINLSYKLSLSDVASFSYIVLVSLLIYIR